jgi:hypothetical protein
MTQTKPSALIACLAEERHQRGTHLRVAAAFVGWAICFAGARWLTRDDEVLSGAVRWMVATVPAIAGVLLLVAYTRYLREIDELQRTIQLQAMAFGFGGGFLAICAYATFVPLGAPRVDHLDLLAMMPVLYSLAVVVNTVRYR